MGRQGAGAYRDDLERQVLAGIGLDGLLADGEAKRPDTACGGGGQPLCMGSIAQAPGWLIDISKAGLAQLRAAARVDTHEGRRLHGRINAQWCAADRVALCLGCGVVCGASESATQRLRPVEQPAVVLLTWPVRMQPVWCGEGSVEIAGLLSTCMVDRKGGAPGFTSQRDNGGEVSVREDGPGTESGTAVANLLDVTRRGVVHIREHAWATRPHAHVWHTFCRVGAGQDCA